MEIAEVETEEANQEGGNPEVKDAKAATEETQKVDDGKSQEACCSFVLRIVGAEVPTLGISNMEHFHDAKECEAMLDAMEHLKRKMHARKPRLSGSKSCEPTESSRQTSIQQFLI